MGFYKTGALRFSLKDLPETVYSKDQTRSDSMGQRNVLGHLPPANTLPRLTKLNSSLNFTAEQVSGCLQIGSKGYVPGERDYKGG